MQLTCEHEKCNVEFPEELDLEAYNKILECMLERGLIEAGASDIDTGEPLYRLTDEYRKYTEAQEVDCDNNGNTEA